MKQRLSPENQKAQHLAVARYVFWGWMIIGLLLMLFYHVPRGLEFSNGLFNIFFCLVCIHPPMGSQPQQQGKPVSRGWPAGLDAAALYRPDRACDICCGVDRHEERTSVWRV